jgi:predicted nucleic acid-binding protein
MGSQCFTHHLPGQSRADRFIVKTSRGNHYPCCSQAIPFIGTLAVVLLAKKRGLVASAADVMRSLQAAGLRLDDEVIRVAMKQTVGEDW